MFKPEILAPGGSFNSAIHAFEAGADAVYIGMSSFSARKGAKNFTLDTLRRLKSYTVSNNKKIFAAINTVLKDSELKEVIILLHHLNQIRIDGIILQDPGLIYIIKKNFPDLEMHASTQMAVHNSQGVQILKDEGFRRIILARELTLEEIRLIRNEHRDIELEVFIHGAMCYSFSGLCLASGRLLGRSGNRGECGQICRTWFDTNERKKYCFSANDMKAGKKVTELAEIGIDSLKIEGRLKSPEYASHTVAYYRSILYKGEQKNTRKEEKLSAVSFSRDQTSAFFDSPRGENLINNRYASHTGIKAGSVLSGDKEGFLLRCETDLSDRDGLLILGKNKSDQFALKSRGKKTHYRKGDTISVIYSGKVADDDNIYKISGHDLQLKEFKTESWKPWKTPLQADVVLNKETISVSTGICGKTVTASENIHAELSTSGNEFGQIFRKNLKKSDTSTFKAETIQFRNRSGMGDMEIFIPLSDQKKIRNSFYRTVEGSIEDIFSSSADDILNKISIEQKQMDRDLNQMKIPSRKSMNPYGGIIPFGSGETEFYPLPPLLFQKRDFEFHSEQIEEKSTDPQKQLILGINNISHIYFVRKYSRIKNISFFTDYCTYIANRASLQYFREKIPKLLFSYSWIEDKSCFSEHMVSVESGFNPHLFVSRICYKLHNGLGSCKNCSRNLSYELKQNDRIFTVIVKDCISWLFQKE